MSTLIDLRPKLNAHFLERSQLLDGLPEEAGFTVWLHAPYGYGKSVLAAQWAARLETVGWRVRWLDLFGRDLKGALARAAGLPGGVPWPVLLEELWHEPTLLVLEDLTGEEDLTPLLKNVSGLVLLASRKAFSSPELFSLATKGRLITLKTSDLAFTLTEAKLLLGNAVRAKEVWERLQGWPLPLHLAALTGELPARRALIEGVRQSLSQTEWEELLLLCALPHLPQQAASTATHALAEAGFVQALEAGYRLHPLAAEEVEKVYPAEVKEATLEHAARLPLLLRGEAFARTGLGEELAELFDGLDETLVGHDPEAVLRWDALASPRRGPMRLQQVGHALCLLGQYEKGVQRLLEAATLVETSPDQLLVCYG